MSEIKKTDILKARLFAYKIAIVTWCNYVTIIYFTLYIKAFTQLAYK